MYLWKNGRFHAGGASFTIPEDFYLIANFPEQEVNYINLLSPDQTFEIALSYALVDDTTEEDLKWMFMEQKWLRPLEWVSPITCGGLTGYQVTYTDEDILYFEARLDTVWKGKNMNFIILLSTKLLDISPARNHPGTKALLDSLAPSAY